MYIDVFDATERKIFLTVIGNGNEARGFRIKVTQLIERQAPPDCLQYYDGITGMIKTFNYDEISRIVRQKFASYFVSTFKYLYTYRLPFNTQFYVNVSQVIRFSNDL